MLARFFAVERGLSLFGNGLVVADYNLKPTSTTQPFTPDMYGNNTFTQMPSEEYLQAQRLADEARNHAFIPDVQAAPAQDDEDEKAIKRAEKIERHAYRLAQQRAIRDDLKSKGNNRLHHPTGKANHGKYKHR